MDEPRPPALNCEACDCRACHPIPDTRDAPPCPCARDFSIDADTPADPVPAPEETP